TRGSVQRHAVGAQRLGQRLEVRAAATHAGRDAETDASGEQRTTGVTRVHRCGGLHQLVHRTLGVVHGHVDGLDGATGQARGAPALADRLADVGVGSRVDLLHRAVVEAHRAGCAARVVADQTVVVTREAGPDGRTHIPLRDRTG